MARGRDLTIEVLSDVDKFNLDAPARDLEDLGRTADATGRDLEDLDRAASGTDLEDLGRAAGDSGRKLDELDRAAKGTDLGALETDAKQAAGGLDKLEKQGDTTARGLAQSFERIQKESRSTARHVDDDAEHASESVKDMGDEIKGEALEGAASFDGSMDSIRDSAQSAAAMALAAFGPVGVGIGVAAAAGYGLFRAQAEKAKEAISTLTGQMIADGGRLSHESVLAKIQEFATDGSILKLKKQAEDARIPVSDYINALAGDGAALDRSTAAIRDRQGALAASVDGQAEFTADTTEMAGALDDAAGSLSAQAEQAQTAREAVETLNGVTAEGARTAQEASAAIDAHAAALDAFVDPVSTYTQLLADKQTAEQESAQATADATEDQGDSWEDYAKRVDVSVDDYLDALERQVKAQEEWSTNLATLANRGVEDGVLAELERMGPEGAPLVAKLATASDKELTRMAALYGRQGAAAGKAAAEGIVGQAGAVRDAAQAIHSGAARIIGGQVNVPIGIERRFSMSDLERLRYDIANQVGTVVVPVTGQSPYTNNANNSRYKW